MAVQADPVTLVTPHKISIPVLQKFPEPKYTSPQHPPTTRQLYWPRHFLGGHYYSTTIRLMTKTRHLEIHIIYIGSKTALSQNPRPIIAPSESELRPTTYVETPIQLGTNRAAGPAIRWKDAQEALEQRPKSLSILQFRSRPDTLTFSRTRRTVD